MKELMATVKNIQKQLAFVLLVLLQSQENSKVASQHSLLIKQSKYRWNWHPSNMHVFYFLCTSFLDRLRIEQCISGALCLTNVIFKWIKASTLTSPHWITRYSLLTATPEQVYLNESCVRMSCVSYSRLCKCMWRNVKLLKFQKMGNFNTPPHIFCTVI